MEQSTNSKLARAKRRRLVWGIIVTVLFILFAIWAGWGWFIFLPLIVDYYFLHFIKWPKLSRIKNKRVRSVVSLLGDVLFAVVGVTLLSTYFFQEIRFLHILGAYSPEPMEPPPENGPPMS